MLSVIILLIIRGNRVDKIIYLRRNLFLPYWKMIYDLAIVDHFLLLFE